MLYPNTKFLLQRCLRCSIVCAEQHVHDSTAYWQLSSSVDIRAVILVVDRQDA